MKLRAYLDTLPRGSVAAFAEKIGVSTVYLSQITSGQNQREPSPALCVTIERESGFLVTRQELRRDWESIWPERQAPVTQQEAA